MRPQRVCAMIPDLNRPSALVACCLAALIVTSSSAAFAEPGELDEATTKRLLSYIEQANALYQAERWSEALDLYARAYELSPQPALLYRMGKSAQNAGKVREAIEHYERFIKALPEEDAARKVAEALPALKASLPAELRVTSTPSSANIYVATLDAAPVGSTPYQGEFEPGEVTLHLKLDGYQLHTQTFDFKGAEREQVHVVLAARSATSASEPVATVSDEERERRAPGSKLKPVGFVTAGLGVASLGAGAAMSVTQARAVERVNNYDKQNAPDPGAARRQIRQDKDLAERSWRNAMILYSVGGLATLTGAGLIALAASRDGSSQEETVYLDVKPTRGGAHVGLSGSF